MNPDRTAPFEAVRSGLTFVCITRTCGAGVHSKQLFLQAKMSPDRTAPFEEVRSGLVFVCIPGHVEQG